MIKKAYYIEALYIVIPLLYITVAGVGIVYQFIEMSVDYSSAVSPYMYMAEEISRNINALALTDVLPMSSSEKSCPSGYNTSAIGYWSGTKPGCYNNFNKTLVNKDCLSLKFNQSEVSKWTDILAQSPINNLIWNKYKLCMKHERFPKVNYTTGLCNSGYKTCSKGSICVPVNQECPLTDVKFNWSQDGSSLTSVDKERNPLKNSLVYIFTSVNGLPCMNPSMSPTPSGGKSYPLERRQAEGCGRFGEEKNFSRQIDTEELFMFYSVNGMLNMIKTLPDYANYLGGNTAVLYYKTKVDINITHACEKIPDIMNHLKSHLQEFTFTSGLIGVLVAYNIILFIFGTILFTFLVLNKENEERGRYFKEQRCLLHAFHFIPYVICILYICQYSQMDADGGPRAANVMQYTNTIVSNSCFNDNQYHQVFLQLRDDVINLKTYFTRTTRIMGVLSYITFVLLLVIKGLRGYYKPEAEAIEADVLGKRFIQIEGPTEPEIEITGDIMMYNSGYEEDEIRHPPPPSMRSEPDEYGGGRRRLRIFS